MTPEQFSQLVTELKKECDDKHKELARLYAFDHSPYKEGDKLECNSTYILIDHIKYTYPYRGEYPSCIYYGLSLKKDGTPRKDKSRDYIYQSSLPKE